MGGRHRDPIRGADRDARRGLDGGGRGGHGQGVERSFDDEDLGGQTATGPGDWFTGTVYIDGIRNPDEQSAVGCAHVRFTPGARTAWHHHPKGQTLYVTDGIGYVARRGGNGGIEVQEIRPGDVVYIEPGEEHWHGATADRFMAHVAI